MGYDLAEMATWGACKCLDVGERHDGGLGIVGGRAHSVLGC